MPEPIVTECQQLSRPAKAQRRGLRIMEDTIQLNVAITDDRVEDFKQSAMNIHLPGIVGHLSRPHCTLASLIYQR